MAEGGGLAARHCVAVAMFEAGRYLPGGGAVRGDRPRHGQGSSRAARRAVGPGRPGLDRGRCGRQGGGSAEPRASNSRRNDPDLWVDRGLSYAAMRAWPRAISDFDRALILRPNDVEILVLRAAAWRNARNPARALDDAGARAQDRAGPFRGAARARLCQPGARRAQPGQQRLQPGAASRAAGLERGPARRSGPARRAAGAARSRQAPRRRRPPKGGGKR